MRTTTNKFNNLTRAKAELDNYNLSFKFAIDLYCVKF